MKIKKSTLNLLLIIILISVLTYFTIKISAEASLRALFEENNEKCANLTSAMLAANKNCFCYFQNFGSGNPEVDKQTDPLCACECIENGTPVTIGVLITS